MFDLDFVLVLKWNRYILTMKNAITRKGAKTDMVRVLMLIIELEEYEKAHK